MKRVVPPALGGARVDHAARELFELPRGAVRRLCDDGRVRLDGKRASKGDRVAAGALLEVQGGGAWLVPDASGPPRVLHLDDDVIVVDKPRGVACHPLVPGEGGTLVDAVAARHPEIAAASVDPREAGLVHRLDTDTTGCTAIARNRAAHAGLRAAFDAGQVRKTYLALVEGTPPAAFVVEDPIAHDPTDARRMCIGAGKSARTDVRVLSQGPQHALVRVSAEGGRRHQVRVHLASKGFPLLGDSLYGAHGAATSFAGHALHAWTLALPGLPLITAPPPADLLGAAAALGCPL